MARRLQSNTCSNLSYSLLTLAALDGGDEYILILGPVGVVEVEWSIPPAGTLNGNAGTEFVCKGCDWVCRLKLGRLRALCDFLILGVELEGMIFTVCVVLPLAMDKMV